jgi:alpha-N-arabinofuranosidase
VPRWPPSHASTGFGETEYAEILRTTLRMNEIIDTTSRIMDRYAPEKRIALVVDEWGAWYAPLSGSNPAFLVQQNSLRDAVLAALNINIFARHAERVCMADIAQMINVLQAMILTDGEKMVLTPTYYVFRM